MRARIGFVLAFLSVTAAFAQHRGGNVDLTPRVIGGFGSVVFPGGTRAENPSIISRSFGNVVFPGGGGPRLVVPGTVTDPTFIPGLGATVAGRNRIGGPLNRGRGGAIAPVYAYPVYVGGVYDPSYLYDYQAPAAPQTPANITIIMPPAPAPVVVQQQAPEQQQAAEAESNFRTYQAPYSQPAVAPAEEQPRYLLAFKDSTVYAAIAYWVEGDTIHYFTAGNKHNRASLSMIDRDLTARLSKQTGAKVELPSAQ